MKQCITAIGMIVILGIGGLCVRAPLVARAAMNHAVGAPPFVISTFQGTAYAPDATGTITSPGFQDKRLVFDVLLRNMPAPSTLGGTVYKVWLIDPTSATVIAGGVLTYHADRTADGKFLSIYHDFTVIAVTAETDPFGANPQHDRVIDGSVDEPALQAALVTHAAGLVVSQGAVSAAYNKVAAGNTTSQLTLHRGSARFVMSNVAATPQSTILLMPLSDPYGRLWISSRGMGTFTISSSTHLPADVKLQVLIINS